MTSLEEKSINLVSETTRIEGKILFDQLTRVHGTIIGEIKAQSGSTLILTSTAVIEGDIQGDLVIIDGYVKGEISASKRVVISRTGRVLGNIQSPSVSLEFGAFFEGRCCMPKKP